MKPVLKPTVVVAEAVVVATEVAAIAVAEAAVEEEVGIKPTVKIYFYNNL
jgi:hypothetical protein